MRFDAVATEVEELQEGDPADVVLENARRKARAGAARDAHGPRPVLGADTDVALDGALLGKPASAERARAAIAALAGRTHEVLGGVVLLGPGGGERAELVRTAVTFRALSAAEIDAYVASGEWRDRAGGYAVQGLGSSLVAAVEGDLSNVIGLPVPRVAAMLAGLQDRIQKPPSGPPEA